METHSNKDWNSWYLWHWLKLDETNGIFINSCRIDFPFRDFWRLCPWWRENSWMPLSYSTCYCLRETNKGANKGVKKWTKNLEIFIYSTYLCFQKQETKKHYLKGLVFNTSQYDLTACVIVIHWYHIQLSINQTKNTIKETNSFLWYGLAY